MDSYLVDCYDLTQISFSKPKKYGEYLASRVKYNGSDELYIQFPKMKITNINPKGIELEFGTNRYNKKMFTWLSKLDEFITETVEANSKEWFNKELSKSQITQMYNKCIKAPKALDGQCTVGFAISPKTVLLNSKNQEILLDSFKELKEVECISQLKFVVFSKDTCFLSWEVCTAKLDTRLKKVPQCAFIEDPDDCNIESEETNEEQLSLCFF